ncbi:AEC family transporter [Aquabacterium fontiphilum]|uniref:AEC family transporter n=1 Tax=Aquabacterium fontiphilum TaxID=450365 RepID=UPI00137743AF|nr:AEC family transporter [Aquabacterium fontiphilum]NBD20466.1 AEC family transporter [Aquabacterium fontiphilum]
MWALIQQFLPFFLLVALGWAATRRGLVPVDGIAALNVFVLYFGLPAMLFRLGLGGALLQPGLSGLVLAYALAGGVVLALGFRWAARQRLGRMDAGMAALVTAFPNTGFLGLPLLTGLLGPQAAGPVAATIAVDVLLFSTFCLAWGHAGVGRWALWPPLGGALRNPLLLSMGAGMVFQACDWTLPGPLDATVMLLGQAASPAALFTLGAILARAGVRARMTHHVGAATGFALAWPVGVKLLVHPVLVWGAGLALQALGLPVSDAGLLALTLAAALPAASNVSMLAERVGADTQVVARIILWTTALALLSLSVWAPLLGLSVG